MPLFRDCAVLDVGVPGEFLLSHSLRIQPDSILVSDKGSVTAACWYYKRNGVYLLGSAGELDYGLSCDESKQRLLNLGQFRELILEHRGTSRVTLFEKTGRYEKQKKHLPAPILKDSDGERVFVLLQY